jgi:hypothetical protein
MAAPPDVSRLGIVTSALGFHDDAAAGAESDRGDVGARAEAGAISTKDGAVTIEFGSGKLEKYDVLRAIGSSHHGLAACARSATCALPSACPPRELCLNRLVCLTCSRCMLQERESFQLYIVLE